MLVVSIAAWLALLLAEVGQFQLAPILFIVGGLGLGVLVFVVRAVLAAAAGIVLGAVLLLAPYETAVQGGDATVYLNFGRQIANEGALAFEDPLLSSVAPDDRAVLFENRVPLDTTGPFARLPGGFLIPDIADPRVTAGFAPLFPVLTALGHAVGPPQLALLVAPIFAIISLIGLWCVARRLGGIHAAWLTVLLTAVSLPQIWFAKLPVPETVAQCLVIAGVLAWLVASATRVTGWAIAAGWFWGLACFAKIDLLVFVPLVLLILVAQQLLTRAPSGGGRPLLVPVCATFGLFMVHHLAHYSSFASHYWPYVADLLQASTALTLLRESAPAQAAVVMAGGLLVATGVAALVRPAWRWPRPLLGLAIVGLLVAYGANYVMTTTNRLDETIPWLSWYISWPVLVLAAAGVLGVGLVRRAEVPPGGLVVGLLLGVVGLHYLYDPLETGVQLDSMRRYVPVVLPFTMLFAAWAVVTLLTRVGARYRLGLTLATGALLIGLVARPSLAVVGQPLWGNALAQTAQVAQQFPPQAVVLVEPELAGTHIQTSLSYLFDVDALLLPAPMIDEEVPVLSRAVASWLARDRAVFVIGIEGRDPPVLAPDLALTAVGQARIELPLLERTRERVPQTVVPSTIPFQLFRVTQTAGAALTPSAG